MSVFRKILQQKKNIVSLWKWDCRSIESRLRKLNYFSTLIDQSIGLGYFTIDFTHHFFLSDERCFFFVRCEYLSFMFSVALENFLWQWHTIEHAQTGTATTKKKKCEKEILMKFMTSKQNPIMQHKCNYMHCIHTTLISISMTMATAANSVILTVSSVGIFFSLCVFFFCLTFFLLKALAGDMLAHTSRIIIIFDNFSDKKITRDKLL